MWNDLKEDTFTFSANITFPEKHLKSKGNSQNSRMSEPAILEELAIKLKNVKSHGQKLYDPK